MPTRTSPTVIPTTSSSWVPARPGPLPASMRHARGSAPPWWAIASSAVVLSIGTYAGGWRIIRTLGSRIIDLTPPQGFAAELTAASILYVATMLKAPISTTHAITAAIMGVGSTRSLKAVRWGVAKSIVGAWIFTFPGAGLTAVLFMWVLRPLTGV